MRERKGSQSRSFLPRVSVPLFRRRWLTAAGRLLPQGSQIFEGLGAERWPESLRNSCSHRGPQEYPARLGVALLQSDPAHATHGFVCAGSFPLQGLSVQTAGGSLVPGPARATWE